MKSNVLKFNVHGKKYRTIYHKPDVNTSRTIPGVSLRLEDDNEIIIVPKEHLYCTPNQREKFINGDESVVYYCDDLTGCLREFIIEEYTTRRRLRRVYRTFDLSRRNPVGTILEENDDQP